MPLERICGILFIRLLFLRFKLFELLLMSLYDLNMRCTEGLTHLRCCSRPELS